MVERATVRQVVINKLYNLYQANGFITEDEALACFVTHELPLNEIDSITEYLLTLNVFIKINDDAIDEDDDVDRTRTNYDVIYAEILEISPGQHFFIDYLRSIRPPQHREWRNLMPQVKNENKYALKRIMDMYLRVAVKIALNSYKNDGYELDDLIQEGVMGLNRAIINYDFLKHGSFVSYFPLWIKQYINSTIANKSKIIRIPIYYIETIKNVLKTIESLYNKSLNEPTIFDIAQKIMITEAEVEKILKISKDIVSIETIMESRTSETYINYINSHVIEDPYYQYIQHEMEIYIKNILDTLTEREEKILRLRYGFDGNERTLEEIGKLFNLTRERIRQIQVKALKKLRHPSRTKYLKDLYL